MFLIGCVLCKRFGYNDFTILTIHPLASSKQTDCTNSILTLPNQSGALAFQQIDDSTANQSISLLEIAMSLASLPSKLIFRIGENMGTTDPLNRDLKLKEKAELLMSLRLTSKRIGGITTRHLFRYLIFTLIYPQSWMKMWFISKSLMATHLRDLHLEM